MNQQTPTRTSATLLGRLRLGGESRDDWHDFTRRYEPLIHGWCRRWGLQDADAQDLSQDVLIRLAARLRSFDYDPTRSFRSYVKTVAHFAWCDLIEARQRPGGGTGDTGVHDRLAAVEARDDLQTRLADAFDREVYDEATARVRLRVEPKTWEAFHLTALEGVPGGEVASRTGLAVAAVYKAKSNIQKMLRDEVARIERREGGG